MKKIIIAITVTLISLVISLVVSKESFAQGQSKQSDSKAKPSDSCDVYTQQMLKTFKAEKDKPIILKNKNQFDKMKKIVSKIPFDPAVGERYLKEINDDKYVLQDVGTQSDVFKSVCPSDLYRGNEALIDFSMKNPKDKKMSKEVSDLLKSQYSKIKNTPVLMILLLQGESVKRIIELKQGKTSDFYTQASKLIDDAANQNRNMRSEESKTVNYNKPDGEWTEKEIKGLVMIMREDAKAAKELSEKLSAILSKI